MSYARSAQAFCAWLVRQGYLLRTPFVKGTVPKARQHPIQLITPEEFERLLRARGPVGELMDHATARNRALLWLFLETGLRVSEVRACRLEDLDRTQGILSVRGNGSHVRHVPLGPHSLSALLTYVDQYRLAQDRLAACLESCFLT